MTSMFSAAFRDFLWDGGVVDKQVGWGWAGVTPIVGDWNGDGKTKIGVYSGGYWYIDYETHYEAGMRLFIFTIKARNGLSEDNKSGPDNQIKELGQSELRNENNSRGEL